MLPPPIVSPNIRVRVPKEFDIGGGSIVDDFCYFSTKVKVGRYSHIASGCTIAGGPSRLFVLGDFSSVSAGVRIWCTSNDYVNDLVAIAPPGMGSLKDGLITGDVILSNYTGVGANAVIMPDNAIPEGTVIGALSFVPPRAKLDPWSVYAGTPVRLICARNKKRVMEQVASLEAFLKAASSSIKVAAHGK